MAKNAKATETKPEEKKEEKATPQPTTTEKIKKTLIDWEKLQTFGILIAMLMGLKSKPAPGSPEEKQIPDWVIALIPESWTLEDESWRGLIINSCENLEASEVERIFRENIEKDPEGYDAGEYRKRLTHREKEYIKESSKTSVKNEPDARVTFKPIERRNPCNAFLLELIAEAKKQGVDEKEIYKNQKRIAISDDYLVKMGGLKKTLKWLQTHKTETLIGIVMIPWGFLQLLIWILN